MAYLWFKVFGYTAIVQPDGLGRRAVPALALTGRVPPGHASLPEPWSRSSTGSACQEAPAMNAVTMLLAWRSRVWRARS